jgi:hypothetical protein
MKQGRHAHAVLMLLLLLQLLLLVQLLPRHAGLLQASGTHFILDTD